MTAEANGNITSPGRHQIDHGVAKLRRHPLGLEDKRFTGRTGHILLRASPPSRYPQKAAIPDGVEQLPAPRLF